MQLKIGKAVHEHRLPTAVLGADLSPDGKSLFAACMDGVYELDVASGQSQQLDRHESYASGAAYFPAAEMLVTGGYDGALQWWNAKSRTRLRRIEAHEFWSWQMARSPNQQWVASATGQYLAGGYKYEPAAEREPGVRVYDARSGELQASFSHVPPVQSVTFSPDSRFVAAANLMGEVRVWDVEQATMVANWTTKDFTSWGVIKSHCYIGGIYALQFSADGETLLAAGMGPMRDPMAGNGRQLWQAFAWRDKPVRKTRETRKDEAGEGLMETLAMHPSGDHFVMAGRLRGGNWNAAVFDFETGRLLDSLKSGYRITKALFDAPNDRLVLAGTQGQPRPKDGKISPFGRVNVYPIERPSE